MTTVIEKLGKLQSTFYEKCGDLYENIELLGKNLYDKMLADIVKTYEEESKQLLREAKIEYEVKKYGLDCKEDALLPGRCGFFWLHRNEPADIIYREVWAEAQQMFKDRTEAVERLEKALDKASENVSPFKEPEETPERSEPAQDEQKPGENVEKQEARQTDKPTETKPQKDEKAKKELPEQLPGQITLDDVQNVQSGKPDTATNTTLTAKKKQAVKPQTRTQSGKAREQNQKEEKTSTR